MNFSLQELEATGLDQKKFLNKIVRKTIFSIKVYTTLLDHLNSSGRHLRWLALFKAFLFLLPGSCIAPLTTKNACQITCQNPSPKPFTQSREIVNLWPGQIPGKGQVQLCQGYKDYFVNYFVLTCPLSWSECMLAFDQKKLVCQDFLCLSWVCFQHQRAFISNNLGAHSKILHSVQEGEPQPFPGEMYPAA
jgi:hypothetical protein